MARVRDVVNYLKFLRDTDERNGEYFSLSNLKLQKLLYYCQAGHFQWDDEVLINDYEFQAWRYGPVIEEVYKEYKIYGQNDIPSLDNEVYILEDNERETISAVWNQLKNLHAYTLVSNTHEEDPWINSYREGMNNIIPNEQIRLFYLGNE